MPKSSTADWIQTQRDFARSLYAKSIEQNEEVEELFKAEWNVPADTGEKATASGPRVTKPARARAYLEKYLTLLSVRAKQKLTVLPHDISRDEQKRCSRIEQWLTGYQRAYQMQTKRNHWRHFVYWYLLRGRGCVETRIDPQYIGTTNLPVRTIVRDPDSVWSVWGENGIGWYVTEHDRYAWDVRREITRRSGGGKKDKWRKVSLPEDDNELVTVTEFWDDERCAATINGEMLYEREHQYGFVPLSEAHCMDTPLADAEWAAQSVLYPIMDSLKQQYALASKMATGVDLFYWPRILVQNPSGQVVMLDSGAPGVESYIPPDAKVTVIEPTPNAPVLQQLMGWLQSDVSLGGIPEIAWGTEPSTLTSGFAVSQVLTQIMDKVYDKKDNIEVALAWDWGHKLRLVEQIVGGTGVHLEVTSAPEYATGGRRKTLVDITHADVEDHYAVEVSITPELPNDRMVKAQLAQAFRAPGADGKPLLDDRTILETVIEVEHPDQVAERIDEQMLPAQSQFVRDLSIAAAEQEFLENNREMVRRVEKLEPSKLPASITQWIEQRAQQLAQEMHAQMMQQQAQAQAQQAQQQAQAGPPPGAMPSQMAAGGVPPDQIPELTQAAQARRGKPVNAPNEGQATMPQ